MSETECEDSEFDYVLVDDEVDMNFEVFRSRIAHNVDKLSNIVEKLTVACESNFKKISEKQA